jgi:hypothetical protein
MKLSLRILCLLPFFISISIAQNNQALTNSPDKPTWWNKYQYLLKNGETANAGATSSNLVGANVDVSNECGPQSETYITMNPLQSKNLAGGSNEIFRDPMRAYASFDGGASWAGTDAPLPPPKGNGIRFGSDPSLAFDTLGNLFYSYIVVFFGNGNGINGTEMAVAKSIDGGRSFPAATFFEMAGGSDHFNDKPMVTVDTNAGSPFKDRIYAAWDAAVGGSTSGGIRVAHSSDHGLTFITTRADDIHGQGRSIGAVPFVGPNGELYVAWNDFANNTIAFNRSFDGGNTWDIPTIVANKTLPFDIGIPAISFRGALVYPACDVDRSGGAHNGRLYCTWMDITSTNTTDIFVTFSDDRGGHWTTREPVTDHLSFLVDRFYPWISIDQTNGDVNISFYDTRNDISGARFMTDIYFTQSNNGGITWRVPNTRVTDVSSNEHDCNGIFPCSGINYGNQYGDYAGLVSRAGTSHPFWTDSRRNLEPASGCRTGLTMEEVFTATVK